MKLKHFVLAAASAATLMSAGAQAQYQFSEEFSSFPLATGADNFIAQFSNAGGGYNDGDIGGSLGMDYSTPVAPSFVPDESNGGFLNFYARYDDPGIRTTALFRNLGGFAGSDAFSANNGEHTLTACVYVPELADSGADFAAGVDGGLGVRISGLGYSQWPTDLGFNASQSVSALTRGEWTRVSLTFDITDGSRVDAGVWVSNPVLSAPYVSTGVFYDDLWLGASADVPTAACAGASSGSSASSDPTGIPVLPLWALFGLAGLIGLMGLRRKA